MRRKCREYQPRKNLFEEADLLAETKLGSDGCLHAYFKNEADGLELDCRPCSPADHLTDTRLGKRDRNAQDQTECYLAEAYTRVGSGESSPTSGLLRSVQERAEKLLLELKPNIFFHSS